MTSGQVNRRAFTVPDKPPFTLEGESTEVKRPEEMKNDKWRNESKIEKLPFYYKITNGGESTAGDNLDLWI